MGKQKDPFDGPKLILEGFRDQLKALATIDGDFFNDGPFVAAWERSADGRHDHFKVKIIKEPPRALRRGVYSAVNDFRNVLDHALNASARALTGKKVNGLHFPFGDDPANLEAALKTRRYSSIPHELYPLLRAFEPYPTGDGHAGGNNLLKSLNVIAQPNKHEIPLLIDVKFSELSVRLLEGATGFGGMANFDFPRLDRDKREVVLLTKPIQGRCAYNLGLWGETIFDEETNRLAGHQVFTALHRMSAMVTVIVAELERETARILWNRR